MRNRKDVYFDLKNILCKNGAVPGTEAQYEGAY